METVDMRRHGDVLLLTKNGFTIPTDIKLTHGTLIHKGTNNSHVIQGKGEFSEMMTRPSDGRQFKYMRVLEDSTVSHVGGSSTHHSKPIPKGDYWVEIQSYYDHLAEEEKQVVD